MFARVTVTLPPCDRASFTLSHREVLPRVPRWLSANDKATGQITTHYHTCLGFAGCPRRASCESVGHVLSVSLDCQDIRVALVCTACCRGARIVWRTHSMEQVVWGGRGRCSAGVFSSGPASHWEDWRMGGWVAGLSAAPYRAAVQQGECRLLAEPNEFVQTLADESLHEFCRGNQIIAAESSPSKSSPLWGRETAQLDVLPGNSAHSSAGIWGGFGCWGYSTCCKHTFY